MAMTTYLSSKNVDLVTRHGIYTEQEFRARYEIYLESYNKLINIEARTMVDMVMHQILPAALGYSSELAESIQHKRIATNGKVSALTETSLVERISLRTDSLYENTELLYKHLKAVPADSADATQYYSNTIIPAMQAVRKDADFLEKLTARSHWPYPTYSDLLFY